MTGKVLTARFCDSVRAVEGRQVDYPDTDVAGLALRVSSAGRKVWTFRYRNAALKQCRVNLGVYSAAFGLADARLKARRLRSDVDEGRDPASDKRVAKARERTREVRTFGDLAEAYFDACEKGAWTPKGKVKRARSIEDEKGVYRRHIKRHFENLPVQELTRTVVRKRLREMFASGIGAQTNKAHQMIRGAFSFAIGEEIEPDLILLNPASGFGSIAPINARSRTITDEEWRAIWIALESVEAVKAVSATSDAKVYVGPHMRLALKLCAFLLQRKGEIIGMKRDELDLKHGVWIVPAVRMKGGRSHLVPLSPVVVELINDAIALNEGVETNCVFPNPRDPSRPMRPDSVSHAMAALTASLAISDASPHDLRRSGASVMTSERLSISPLVRSRVLGHSSDTGGGAAVTAAHYDANSYAAEKRVALVAWQGLLLKIVGQSDDPAEGAAAA